MISKASVISAPHGANAVNYAMGKDGAVLLRAHGIPGCAFGSPSPQLVWDLMRLRQRAARTQSRMLVFRMEVAPAPEEVDGFRRKDWLRLLDDFITALDGIEERGRDGKMKARRSNIRGSQYVAMVHYDSGKPHIHIVANRVDEDTNVQDAFDIGRRAKEANRIVSQQRGWQVVGRVRGKDGKERTVRPNKRKAAIIAAARAALLSMEGFSHEAFFAAMRERGYEIRGLRRDSAGRCVGYSIRDTDRKAIFTSSKVSRELTPGHLEATWRKLHAPQREAVAARVEETSAPPKVSEYLRMRGSDRSGATAFLVRDGEGLHAYGGEAVRIAALLGRETGEEGGVPSLALPEEDARECVVRLSLCGESVTIAVLAAVINGMASGTPSGGGGVQGQLTRWDGRPVDEPDEERERWRRGR